MSDDFTCTFRITQAELASAMRSAGGQLQRRRSKKVFAVFMVGIFVLTGGFMVISDVWFGFEPELSHMAAFFLGLLVTLGIVAGNARMVLRETAALSMAEDEARGEVEARFTSEGVYFKSGIGESLTKWVGVSEVMDVPEATALRMGAIIHPIPDRALAQDPAAFRAQLRMWKDASL